MSQTQELAQLQQQIQQLQTRYDELKANVDSLDYRWGRAFDSSEHLRRERFPTIYIPGAGNKNFAVLEGTEDIILDRWEYIAPNTFSNGGLDVVDLTVNNTDVILDTSIPSGGSGDETGKLLGICCWVGQCNAGTWGTPTCDVTMYIEVDGGTPQPLDVCNGLSEWNWAALLGWATNVNRDAGGLAGQPWGTLPWQDAFALPFNFEYRTKLRVYVVVENCVGWAAPDLWEMYVRVDRARVAST